MDTTQETFMYFNGINGDDGSYEIPPLSTDQLKQLIRGEEKPENRAELEGWSRYRKMAESAFGVVDGVDANLLDQSGWGVILPNDIDPQIVKALAPLLKLREEQAGKYYYKFEGDKGFSQGYTKDIFLKKNDAGPGPANPKKVPYYLLLVGSPEKIPYSFQVQMDVQYSVGRIYFDTLQEYANYANNVVAAETGQVKLPRQAAFFAPANPDDPATQLSLERLVQPVIKNLTPDHPDWVLAPYLKEQATKAQLAGLLGGQAPALLFSASHGMGFNLGSDRQLADQGALLCQDWTGPRRWREAVPKDFYFAASDIPKDANLLGLVAFFFACYGLGTPVMDQFSKQFFKNKKAIAPRSFLAELPVKMLGRPGGALAVVGHIERAWGCSFKWADKGTQSETFESALGALLRGKTVGYALEYFNNRYAELSTDLSMRQDNIEADQPEDPYDLASIWTANNDARGYALLGDPAVRLPVAEAGESIVARPAVAPQPVEPPQPVVIHSTTPAPAQTTGQAQSTPPKTQPKGRPGMENYSPPPVPLEQLSKYPALEKAWIKNFEAGYKNTDQLARSIRTAFLVSHYSTLIMYWLIFALGIVLLGVGLSSNTVWVSVIGAVGLSAFLVFFFARSAQAVEQNLLYITWIGIIYNSYWVHQLWSTNPESSQGELDKATSDAITQIRSLIDRYEQSYKKRDSIQDKPGTD